MKNYKTCLMVSLFSTGIAVGIVCPVWAQSEGKPEVKIIWNDGIEPKYPKGLDEYNLVPHTAVYRLKMQQNNTPTKLSDIQGKMDYHFVQTCESWITDQALNLEMVQTDGIPMRSVNNFFSDERFDGSEYHYSSENVINKQVVERSVGTVFTNNRRKTYFAYRQGMGGTFEQLNYKDVMFPVRHVTEILSQTKKGKNIYHATVFDGSFSGEPVSINAIASEHDIVDDVRISGIFGEGNKTLLSPSIWSISYAYYKNDKQNSEEQEASPDYESVARMMDNGIITELTIKYPDFVLKGELVEFELLSKPVCK